MLLVGKCNIPIDCIMKIWYFSNGMHFKYSNHGFLLPTTIHRHNHTHRHSHYIQKYICYRPQYYCCYPISYIHYCFKSMIKNWTPFTDIRNEYKSKKKQTLNQLFSILYEGTIARLMSLLLLPQLANSRRHSL